MTNAQIAKLLRNIAASYIIKDEKKFRFQIIAYQKAADTVDNTTSELKDLYKEHKLVMLPGIGPTISKHLEELFKTGKVKHFEWVFKGIPEAVFPLLDVPTIGPKKAYRLAKEFDLKSDKDAVDNLFKIAKSGKIASLEGFGEKSEADIIRAIAEFKKGSGKAKRMVLPYAYELAEKLISYLKKSKYVEDAYPLGSLRRMVSTVGDIDIAVSTTETQKAIEYFTNYPYKDRIIEKGPTSASLLLTSGQQVDLIALPPKQLGSLLQHFTGSKNHNVHLREYAIKHGMSLSERGIKRENKKGVIEEFNTEEKFYKVLGMEWIAPELREDTGEIELALTHKLPKLVDLKDIKGDLHIHSSYPIEPSHDLGQNTMEEMIEKAIELKYEYLGFSEHNPSISKHSQKKIYDLLAKRTEKIESLKAKYKNIKIINLMETDILTSGELALSEKALSLLDATFVSIHSSFNTNKNDMTKRVLKGFSHPKAKILCHPTGRQLNQRTGYELDFEQIFDFCKKNNKALEINSWPSRLDLPDAIVKDAVKNGIKMVINTDSHEVSQMDLMRYGVSVARRGWAEKSDILNTLPYNMFIKWLNPSYAKATEGEGR